MMKLIIFSFLLAGALAAPASQSMTFNDDGSYRFYYETGKDGGSHSREEFRNPDGVVVGKFSYEDPNGELREVNYRADESGYIAEGDVSVPDVPKGKFPADVPEEVQSDSSQEISAPQIVHTEEVPVVDYQPEAAPNEISSVEEAPSSSEEDEGKDDMNDLALEESTANDPPEAFPEGFFLQHFQGLRRLPEPTTEAKEVSTEPPAKEDIEESSSEISNEQPEPSNGEDTSKSGVSMFSPLRPFPHFSAAEWVAALHHQPVYVYSYQQPDSYGYHYFF
ncbi:LOW QUALITY PROTEIN: uncharacterized protein LOC129222072 [Uloborus diversus]|uniref:LOW QUALITY PROTEIN: uncharacterized protein LOC129222072 n=1 Tax=Uloborus diversus TaxID=327109 RepID=UPI00240A3BB1|nr:LOW QUALITY PROTEIN: uncharacterized protein LOC129222072 [Uloborus diversus]